MFNSIVRFAVRSIAVGAAALAIWYYVILPWRADHVLYTVQQRTEAIEGLDGERSVVTARNNIQMLHRIERACRTNASFYMLYAFNLRILHDPDGAIEQYTNALLYADHRPEIYFARGTTWVEKKEIDRAADDLIRAARFNPFMIGDISGELRDRVARAVGPE